MTQNSSNNQVPDFITKLENSLDLPINAIRDSGKPIAENVPAERPGFQKLILSSKLGGRSILKGALHIFRKNFLAFVKVNLILTASFWAVLFLLILQGKEKIENYIIPISNFLHSAGFKSIWPIIYFLLFWLFFSLLRSSYLAIVGNYVRTNENFKPISLGLTKLTSFILIELMQVVMFLIGTILLLVWPIFATRYFVALPAMINQSDGAVNSLFESEKYVKKEFFRVFCCVIFITFLTILIVTIFALLSHYFISNKVVFWSFNFFMVSFVLLPIHACYRFLLYEKICQVAGEIQITANVGEKIWFTNSRIVFLALAVINIFLIATGTFGSAVDKILLMIGNTYGQIF